VSIKDIFQWLIGVGIFAALVGCASQPLVTTVPGKDESLQYQVGVAAYNHHNYAKALNIWVDLADKGDAEAINALGMMYQSGKGVSRDVGVAARLYKKAANAGLPAAQNNLAVMYESGEGVDQDLDTAVKLYQQSASQGYIWAQYNLGRMHASGIGVQKDPATASEYFEQAEHAKEALNDATRQPNR